MLDSIARVIERRSLERLECYGPRKGISDCVCGHDRPFEKGENWVCPICFDVPPTHDAALDKARANGLRAMMSAMVEKTRDQYEREAMKHKRRTKKRHAA